MKCPPGNRSNTYPESQVGRINAVTSGLFGSAAVITDRGTGQSRGFGFVEMGTDEEAQKAIAMFNGKDFMERPLTVNEARPQQKRERTGGGGGGGYGGGGGRGPRR